ncbi:MAG: NADH-quinone oxidoreductase subunit L [Planctomycetota bacterium]
MFNLFPLIPVLLLLLFPIFFNALTVSSIMYLLVNTVSFCIFLYSTWYMKTDKRRGLFMIYLTLFTLFMNILTVANDYITFFIGWEGVGLTSFLLIGFWFEDKENLRKAKQAFLLTKLTDIGYIVGAGYLMSKQINLIDFTQWHGSDVPTLIRFLMFTPCIGKSALFPLFIWLPNAMVAPTPVSAHLHSATMVAAGVFYLTRFKDIAYMPEIIIWFILAGYFIVSLLAFLETDIKRLLAYSTLSHLSLMYLGFAAGYSTNKGNMIPFYYMILHAFTKAPLFLIAGVLIHQYHTQNLIELRGVLYKNNLLKVILLFLTLSLAGFLFIGIFWSKFYILVETASLFGSEVIPIAITLLSSAYCARFYFLLTSKAPLSNQAPPIPKIPTISILILFVFLLGLSIYIPISTFHHTGLTTSPFSKEHIISVVVELIVMVFVFTIIYLKLDWVAHITTIQIPKKYIVLERIYYNIFQIPVQFLQFFCRTQIEELWDKFVNSFLSSDFARFIHNAYRVFYNGLIYNYLLLIVVSLLVLFLLYRT